MKQKEEDKPIWICLYPSLVCKPDLLKFVLMMMMMMPLLFFVLTTIYLCIDRDDD